jgi:parvulin-like peptidyl-prolyl isomerase
MSGMEARKYWNGLSKWRRRVIAGGVASGIVAGCFALRPTTGPGPAAAQVPEAVAPTAEVVPGAAVPPQAPSDVAAFVNGVRISRAELAQECLRLFGDAVLESVVNRTLIADYCAAHQIVVTKQQVSEEIDRTAERFAIPKDEWLKMLQTERGISPQQYANDIVWPTVALRHIAAQRIQPTEQELAEAYETLYGPSVQCRLIAFNDRATAEQVLAKANASPDDFGNLAKTYSVDVNSASAKGLIQPIRKHMGDPGLEKTAFALQKGQISEIIQVGQQFVILKCENQYPARPVPLEQVQKTLAEAVRDKKLRLASADVFTHIKTQSQVDLIFTDPARRAQFPAVAAVINGREFAAATLAEECLARNGKEVLEGMIGRTLLVDALAKARLELTQQDIDAEIARAALAMGKTTTPGGAEADVAGWIKEVTEKQKIPYEQYVHDTVWPTVALKKLVAPMVQVTDEDLTKGFEANYGPRVKCRAIVHNQMRKAQEVWELARDNPTAEHFGMLAEQYSIDTVSRALRGEVPPLQKHGGQPILEREAFQMKPGELSGIIQVEDNFVILFCEGLTQPRPIDFNDVRDLIRDDVYEKKLRLAMAKEYSRLQDSAKVDNFIAGTVKSPTLGKSIEPAGGKPQAAGGAVQAGFNAPVQQR